jgi:hypothetical protein
MAGEGGMLTLVGVIVPQVRPDGTGVSDRAIVPVKPLADVTVIVEFAGEPMFEVGEVAVIVKSTTVTVIV